MTKTSTSPTFCPEPWTTLNIDQTGNVLPCLHSYGWDYQKGKQNSLGSIKEQTIQSIISGPTLNEIRKTIAQGEWHSYCQSCQHNEATGGHSARLTRRVDTEVLDQIDQNIDFFKLVNLTVCWSNLCNLTCTYCNPETSTAWQHIKKIPITHIRNKSDDLVQLAKDNKNSLIGLTLGGGEPLLQPGLLEFLKEIDSSRVKVVVTTNLIVDLDKNSIYQELRKWPNLVWQISFDNVDPVKFNYVRRGASWEMFERNLQHLLNDRQHVVAHPAYSIYCAFDLDSYFEFCQSYNIGIYWCDLVNPMVLDARKLPQQLRDQAKSKIDQILEHYGNDSSNNHRLSLDILKRYHTQLDLPVGDTVSVDEIIKWHRQQEQTMVPSGPKFEEIWTELIEQKF
jgi:radical SAM protein with 4Fe4S-binding SPASM domain